MPRTFPTQAISSSDPPVLATRYRLLEAAARCIAARGFDGASVRQIAADVGLTSGAIYRHFPGGKDELYTEILSLVARSIHQFVSTHLHSTGDLSTSIVELCGLCWDFFADHPSFASLIAREGISGGPTSPYFHDNIATMEALKSFLATAREQGAIACASPAHFVFAAGTYCIDFHGASALRDALWAEDERETARTLYLDFVRRLLNPGPAPG